jgi:hypothetical protein
MDPRVRYKTPTQRSVEWDVKTGLLTGVVDKRDPKNIFRCRPIGV